MIELVAVAVSTTAGLPYLCGADDDDDDGCVKKYMTTHAGSRFLCENVMTTTAGSPILPAFSVEGLGSGGLLCWIPPVFYFSLQDCASCIGF